MGNPGSLTVRMRVRDALFLEALAADKSVAEAADEAGYSRAAVYRYRKSDPEFRAAWDEATEVAVERLESEWTTRARGVERPVFYSNKIVGTQIKYSDRMLIARLKSLRPERYDFSPAATSRRRAVAHESGTCPNCGFGLGHEAETVSPQHLEVGQG